jgi:hypothetical protein
LKALILLVLVDVGAGEGNRTLVSVNAYVIAHEQVAKSCECIEFDLLRLRMP